MMLRITRDNHVHKMARENEPCIRVDSGTRLVFEAWDALEGDIHRKYDPDEPAHIRMSRVNPATGPVYVHGAEPGDVLQVEINDIMPFGTGYLNIRESFVSYEKSKSEPVFTEFEYRDGKVLFKGIWLPTCPMIGVIGTAPEQGMFTQEAGDHGGNMDSANIKKGSTVLFPVFVEGGLLAMGDVHAAMGDGEVFGQGIEIKADIDVTVSVRKDISLRRPVVFDDERIACIAAGYDIEEISYMAVRDMGDYLAKAEGLTWDEAAVLIALYGDVKICQLVNPQKTVRIEVPRKCIELVKRK